MSGQVKAIPRPPVILPPRVQRPRINPAPVVPPPVPPRRYVYVPGLAREELVQNPCLDALAFITRIGTVFGYRTKRIWEGRDAQNNVESDAYMTGAVKALCETKAERPLNCGRSLRWLPVSGLQAQSKAFRLLGTPQQNLLALNPGQKPKAPKPIQYGNSHWVPCLAAECIAHPKGKVLPPNDQNLAQPNEAKTLARLRANDILCIVGHGNPLGATLTYKCPPPASHRVKDSSIKRGEPGYDRPGVCQKDDHMERWHVDPNTLAVLLVEEGLPITHQNIEMIMCYGAGLSLTSGQTVQSFCQRLAGALNGFGYKQIKVRGTFGMVMGPDLSVNPSLTPDGKKLVVDPNKNVEPNDPHHEDLFVTYTPTTMKVGRRPEVRIAQS